MIVGSVIGTVSALICYHMFWPNPWSATNFDYQSFGQPRFLYVENTNRGEVQFELAAVDEDRTTAV